MHLRGEHEEHKKDHHFVQDVLAHAQKVHVQTYKFTQRDQENPDGHMQAPVF